MKKIVLENIIFGYSKKEIIFDNVSLELSNQKNQGQVIALMGESGSGKTTLLKLLLGLEKPLSGSIKLIPENSIYSYVPQDPVLFEHLSPMENATYFKRTASLRKHFNEDIFNKISKSLDLEKVLNSKKTKISKLSGGQKQRISLLRALSIKPDILFLDEPCNGLDQEVKLSFLLKLRQITEELRILVIYITHHYDEAKFISDQICYLVKDEKDDVIQKITKQSFEEFSETPPSKAALSLLTFPVTNLLKIKNSDNDYTLTDYPDCLLYLGNKNIALGDKQHANFNKVLQSDSYSIYKHNSTENFIVLENNITMNTEVLNIQLKGTLLCYDVKGIYLGKKDCKNLI